MISCLSPTLKVSRTHWRLARLEAWSEWREGTALTAVWTHCAWCMSWGHDTWLLHTAATLPGMYELGGRLIRLPGTYKLGARYMTLAHSCHTPQYVWVGGRIYETLVFMSLGHDTWLSWLLHTAATFPGMYEFWGTIYETLAFMSLGYETWLWWLLHTAATLPGMYELGARYTTLTHNYHSWYVWVLWLCWWHSPASPYKENTGNWGSTLGNKDTQFETRIFCHIKFSFVSKSK